MNWKVRILLFYTAVSLAGILFVEFQNLFILESSWKYVLKYNLPFVLLQNLIFVLVYYFYTIKKIGPVFQITWMGLTYPERKDYFDQLVSFPYQMFRFSIIFMVGLALSFHLYEVLFVVSSLSKEFFIRVFLSFLREISLAMVITLTIVAVLRKLIRPYILQLQITTFDNVQLSLSKKIYFIFFALLFVFVTDISWLILHADHSEGSVAVKVFATVCLLSVLSVIIIRFTILDSVKHIQTIAESVSKAENDQRLLQQTVIPITSSDEISFLVGNFNKLQAKAKRLYAELEDELRLAFTVQQHLLPRKSLALGGYAVEGYTLPVKDVGGDFFDFEKISEHKLVLFIGDVSGKGVPAALVTSVALGAIRSKLQTAVLSPAALLTECNHLLLPMLPEGMYVTACIAVVDVETNVVTYASAGHVPPLVKRNGKLDYLETSSLPIGFDDDETYEEQMLPLADLDGIVFYTDGIIEQTNQRKQMYGFDRFHRLFKLDSNWNQDMPSVMKDLSEFYVNTKRLDDMTIVRLKKGDAAW